MPAAFTVRVDDETLAALDKLAASTERPRNWLMKEALKTYLAIQTWQVAKIEAGIAAADRGEFAADDELDAIEAELDARFDGIPMKWRWTKPAKDDLREFVSWIAEENPTAALQHVRKIRRSVAKLEQFPHLGRIGRIEMTREWVIPGTAFIVAYRLRSSQLEILAVIHTARRWPDKS